MVSAALTFLVGGFAVTVVLEWLVLRVTQRLQLVAIANARSSHVEPTPTMGGLAIVFTVSGFLLLQAMAGVDASLGLLAGGGLLALVGLRDDISDISAVLRLICHVVAVCLMLYTLDLAWPTLWLAGLTILLVWQVNLFNFMDGIDGIAGAQLLLFCVGVIVISGGVPGWLGELLWLLSGSALAFLAFNWPPAKIFMGDVGSGFLGLVLGFLVVALAQAGFVPFIASLILLAGFWFDASYTLCVRILTGQQFASAHRSHLYQILAARHGHRWTTLMFGGFCVSWLMPLAWLSTQFPERALLCLIAAPVPCAVLALRNRVGLPPVGPYQNV
jgi:Fuc2NAc and GlcNAc transferase